MEDKDNTGYYQKIIKAREILGTPEKASMKDIKTSFRKHIMKWHPDKAGEGDEDMYREKSQEIIWAYNVLMDYCREYLISFSKESIKRYMPEEEFWKERFGSDHVWGPG